MGFFQKPFGYEPILTKDDLKQAVKKRRGHVQLIGEVHCCGYGKLSMNNVHFSLWCFY